MSIAKILEIVSSSTKSFEDAVEKGISRTTDSLTDVTGAWVQDQKVIVKNGKIVEYRVNLKITFVLKDKKQK